MRLGSLLMLAALSTASPALANPTAAGTPVDPLGSPMWSTMATVLMGKDAKINFDPRVKLSMPVIAENQHVFPVTVDARELSGVRRVLIFADLGPIPLAVDFAPQDSAPFLSVRIKLDQRTPVRAAVQLADGSWHVSARWIDAAGGGCSAPPVSRVKGDWAQHLGEVRGVALAVGNVTRLRLAFRHPMDTGLVDNIPAYNLESVALTDQDGRHLGVLKFAGSVAEDPALGLIVPTPIGQRIDVAGRDTNGIEYKAALNVGAPVTVATDG